MAIKPKPAPKPKPKAKKKPTAPEVCSTCDGEGVIAGGERGEAMELCPSCRPAPRVAGKKDANGLTPRQEKFAQEYVVTGNASEAYRRSYSTAKSTAKTINEAASRTLADDKVSARVKQLQSGLAKRNELTVDDIVTELEEARQIGKATRQSASMVSASMGKAKLLGMVIDRKEITVHSIIGGMTDDELSQFIDEVDVDSEDYEGFAATDDAS